MTEKHEETLLVTGAGGFVGRHVVAEALGQGYAVRATDLESVDLSWAREAGATVVAGDLTVRSQVQDMLRGARYVAHIAAAYDLSLPASELMRINRDGTRLLAELAAQAGVAHFVACSTADTYGTHGGGPVPEHFEQRPENDYARSKLAAEMALMEVSARLDLSVTLLRPTVIYGPGSLYIAALFCCIPVLLQRHLGGMPRLRGGPLVSALHVEDMARAAVFAVGHREMAGEAYNVCDDSPQTVAEFIHNLAEPLNVRWAPFTLPVPTRLMGLASRALEQAPEAAFQRSSQLLQRQWTKVVNAHGLAHDFRPRLDRDLLSYGRGDHVYDNAKLKEAGFELRWPDFARGYRQTVAWYREHGWVPQEVATC